MRVLLLAIFLSFSFLEATKAQGALEGEDNYFVIIGAFADQKNADRLVRQSKKFRLSPAIEFNRMRNLYYVYVLRTGDRAAAVTETLRLRAATAYSDAWVFNGIFGEEIIEKKPVPEPVVEVMVPVEEVKEEVPEPTPPPELTEHEKIKLAVDNKTRILVKGEVETLHHIYFFRDAAILRPESRYEVDRLVELLNSHPTERIRIHGHTNGNDRGTIIRLRENSTDFFSLDNAVEDYGSAVKLSELRATVIADYLISYGIQKNRMEIKAWGGKKPLYKVDDDKAEANVRVEIEVLHK